MKKFQFRLQFLLRYREYRERLIQLELAQIRAQIQACETRLNGYRNQFDETLYRLEHELDKGIEANRYMSFNDYLAGIESNIEQEKSRRQNLIDTQKRKQNELLKWTVDKKILIHLKQRQKEAYYSRMLKNSQKETDDMLIVRKARGKQL